jgi:MSHA biogenesis protein MshG
MTNFYYKGKNNLGEIITGEMDSVSPDNVSSELMKVGIFPIEIKEVKNQKKQNFFKKKLNRHDLLLFTREMYILIKSGVPLTKALKSMEISNENILLKAIYQDIRMSIDNGYELNMALQKHDNFFSVFYINMVRIGEITGRLEEVFLKLYEYIDFEEDMKKKGKSALRYPSIVLSVMALAFIVVMTFVIPTFAKVYNNFHAQLPIQTRILIGISHFMIHNGLLLFILLSGIFYSFKYYIKTENGRLWWDKIKFEFPIIGKTIKKSVLARFSKSFSIAIKSGLPIVQSLNILSQIVDNVYIAKHIENIRENVEKGNTLYASFKSTNVFQPLVLEMIATGEEAGQLDIMTDEISKIYEEEIAYELKTLSDNLEPLVLLLLGGLLLVFALGVLLPTWNLTNVILKK